MALLLHLETATKVCSVALSRDGVCIALKETEEEGYSHGENLTLFIRDVLQEVDLEMKDLDAVSLASGPGSYTGLRIGAATAKGICYALNIPLIAIDALTSLCELAREKHSDINLCAMIDARRMEVFSLIRDASNAVLKPISADVLEGDSYQQWAPFVYFGDGATKFKELWEKRNVVLDDSIRSSALGQIRLAHEKYQAKEFEDVAYWEPYYLKDFVVQAPKSEQ